MVDLGGTSRKREMSIVVVVVTRLCSQEWELQSIILSPGADGFAPRKCERTFAHAVRTHVAESEVCPC